MTNFSLRGGARIVCFLFSQSVACTDCLNLHGFHVGLFYFSLLLILNMNAGRTLQQSKQSLNWLLSLFKMVPTEPVSNEPVTAVYVIWGGLYKMTDRRLKKWRQGVKMHRTLLNCCDVKRATRFTSFLCTHCGLLAFSMQLGFCCMLRCSDWL